MSTETSCHFGHLLLVSNHRRQQFPTNPLFYMYFFPIQKHKGPNLTLPLNRSRSTQGQYRKGMHWYLFDTVLKVTSWPAFVSRCIIDANFSFYGLVLDIDMNCGCRLYRSFWQMDLTYAMDCLLNSITGMNVAFLLTVSPPYTQLWLSQTD